MSEIDPRYMGDNNQYTTLNGYTESLQMYLHALKSVHDPKLLEIHIADYNRLISKLENASQMFAVFGPEIVEAQKAYQAWRDRRGAYDSFTEAVSVLYEKMSSCCKAAEDAKNPDSLFDKHYIREAARALTTMVNWLEWLPEIFWFPAMYNIIIYGCVNRIAEFDAIKKRTEIRNSVLLVKHHLNNVRCRSKKTTVDHLKGIVSALEYANVR